MVISITAFIKLYAFSIDERKMTGGRRRIDFLIMKYHVVHRLPHQENITVDVVDFVTEFK